MKAKYAHTLTALLFCAVLLFVSAVPSYAEETGTSTPLEETISPVQVHDKENAIIVGGKTSSKPDSACSGPGVQKPDTVSSTDTKKGESLGIHTITGYDPTVGTLTYSGKTAQPNHTIAADLSLYPLGTKLWINGIIYEVEDCGSMVVGKFIDIFFATHEETLAFGMTEAEVFTVKE